MDQALPLPLGIDSKWCRHRFWNTSHNDLRLVKTDTSHNPRPHSLCCAIKKRSLDSWMWMFTHKKSYQKTETEWLAEPVAMIYDGFTTSYDPKMPLCITSSLLCISCQVLSLWWVLILIVARLKIRSVNSLVVCLPWPALNYIQSCGWINDIRVFWSILLLHNVYSFFVPLFANKAGCVYTSRLIRTDSQSIEYKVGPTILSSQSHGTC